MKIYVIALYLFIFSSVVSIYNEIGIFGDKPYDPGVSTINEAEVSGIFQIESGATSNSNWIDDTLGGIGMIAKMMGMVWKMLGNAVNLGGMFSQYVPGTVGTSVGLMITAITWFVYAWGGIQLWQKVSTKNMD